MKAIVFVLISLCAFYAVEGQLCRGRTVFDAEEMCPFPGGKSCCSANELEHLRVYLDTLLGTVPKDCHDYFRGLICAGCDPLSRGDEVLCRSFCEKFVKGCFKDLIGVIPDFDEEICAEYPETNCFRGFEDFEPLPPRSICGQFGDPHIRLFSGEFKTCKALGKAKMFKSSNLAIVATNEQVHSSGASVTKELEVTYKDEKLSFSVSSRFYPTPSSKYDINYFEFLGGRTYLFSEIDTRLSVTYGTNEIFFTLSTPDEGESGQICKSGCTDTVDISAALSTNFKRADADAVCSSAGLQKGTYHYEACLFDVSITNDDSYATSVAEYAKLEEDAIAEEEYRKKSSSLNAIVNIFMLVILSLISLMNF